MSTKGITSHDHKKSAQEQSTHPSSRSSELTTTPTQPVPAIQTSRLNPTIMNPRNVMQLQKTIGNRATDKLLSKSEGLSFNRASASTSSNSKPLQAKLTVTPAGDKYEQEADQVAKQVINRITSPVPQSAQRQEPEEEELQMKPIQPFDRLKVQRQEEEEELQMKPFDRLRVNRQEEEEELLQGKFQADALQRQVPEEEELMTKPAIQRVGLEGGDIDSDTEAAIHQASGSGQPLPGSVREPAENALGADFSSVKVHTGSESDSLNSSLQSRAFTTGPNIFFKQGEYNPGSSGGQELIAHELTHVVQQGAGKLKASTNQGSEKDE
ncbi:Translation initiation factor 2 (IF-2; GTPase) [Olavius sp. associated proteobacterium Delta 1]|nr:Translation initiation factor 2 (IF-2; GTPase) [Olavius sp. associated proteobacterium Delta 1]